MDYALTIGLRYLRSKKKKTVSVITFIAVSGVALGVAALLVVMSITSGFQVEFRNKVLGVNAHVLVMKYGLDFEEYEDVMARAMEMPEVAGAAPFVINEMMLARGDRIAGVLVKGVDPVAMPTVLDLPTQLVDGSLEGLRREGAAPPRRPDDEGGARTEGLDLDAFLERIADGSAPEDAARATESAASAPAPSQEEQTPDDDEPLDELPVVRVPTPEEAEAALEGTDTSVSDGPVEDVLFEDTEAQVTPTESLPGVVVGATLARTLDLHVGDRVSVISPLSGLDTSMFHAEARTPRSREFRVIGVFEAGFQEYDSRLVYADLYEAQAFFDHGDSVTGVEIRLHDLEQAPAISRRLERVLGGGPYHTLDWQELNHNLFTALEIQKVMLSLVIATIIFIAAFNVIATLIMIVLEKKREIAILKAMGAHDLHVLVVFLVQGLIIGLVGTVIGLALGGGVSFWLESYRFPLDPHVYLIDHVPVRTSMSEFGTTVLIALGICLVATLLPSWWAARLLPAEGVRYE
ncbi:ABC transporter permease [Sandaracinus amylolyticus]|uniref:Lipoprotein releasing system transmembrane protein LolC n=1 Tax=Sandaracinus amylolyticus TaxID=927083 RepID=A0A0F6YL25_9BACT|nr:ABC transporter permease [Sandaracinus amylolyticus]AKF08838.1 Lipoprotein releasing system transmembrane protein LolC [Sandaracinus amylolyticus]